MGIAIVILSIVCVILAVGNFINRRAINDLHDALSRHIQEENRDANKANEMMASALEKMNISLNESIIKLRRK